MATTFYFYDLETSGFSARSARIMQFAGQRTDMNLKPIGEPDNMLVCLSEDILPDPDAVLVTGITPQATRADGISEAELAKYLTSQVFLPDTIAVGYNNIRFDNEFIRHLLWRNFTDAYEWQWQDGRSTWDLLDLARMARALRPEGIKWPFAPDGKPSNRLELLSSANRLEHGNAHDALADVNAAIELARLLKLKQPKLFDYLLGLRNKAKVAVAVTAGQPIVYTSGRYPAEYEKTTVAVMVAEHSQRPAALMYDLRVDPDKYAKMTPQELATAWQYRPLRPPSVIQGSRVEGADEQQSETYKKYDERAAQSATEQSAVNASGATGSAGRAVGVMDGAGYFPIKILAYNRCPAIAPDLRVLDIATQKRLGLDMDIVAVNHKKLQKQSDLGDRLAKAIELMNKAEPTELVVDEQKVDELLYDGFVPPADKSRMSMVRAADQKQLAELDPGFTDQRLSKLLPLYKARNYPSSLTAEQQQWWEDFRTTRLLGGGDSSRAAQYFKRLEELGSRTGLSGEDKYLLEELKLYGQAVIPDL